MRRTAALLTAAALAVGAAIAPPSPSVEDVPALGPAACDPIDPAHCLLPFPSDHHTVEDPTAMTGRRVAFTPEVMPRNVAGKPIDPTAWNRNDGFSPGSAAIALVPGLDLHQTWGTADLPVDGTVLRRPEDRDHIADIARYARDDAPILLLDADTGERHPFWSELDTHPQTTDDRRTLLIRPAVNLEAGHRYLVVLRDLRDADGALLDPDTTFPAFAAMRDAAADAEDDPATAERRAEIRRVLADAAAIEADRGFDRDAVVLAWDFTVASRENVAERVLHMRDDVFDELGDDDLDDGVIDGTAPTVLGVTVDDRRFADRRVLSGRLVVPNFLTHDVEADQRVESDGQAAVAGYRLLDPDGDGIPQRNPAQPTTTIPFDCQIPTTDLDAAPFDLVQYGHGLLGRRGEALVTTTEDLRRDGFAVCATDWLGMSRGDLPNVASVLTDVSLFPTLVDRSQMGLVAKLLLGRWMAHPDGFGALEAVRELGGVRSGQVEFVGHSQGAIMGGALVAVAPDYRRAVLGVPGMNFSTLLNRSVDFEGVYSVGLYAAYPDKADQQLVFQLMQMLWDRSETNGYASFAATGDPALDTPPHQILLQVGFSDHQVPNVAAEVEARTMGAAVVAPLVPGTRDPLAGSGRPDDLHWSVDPTFGLDVVRFADGPTGPVWTADDEPVRGSAIVYWYGVGNHTSPPSPDGPGNPTPPNGNVPPARPEDGHDPHEQPRRDDAASRQVHRFLRTGELLDVCGGQPCLTSVASRASDR